MRSIFPIILFLLTAGCASITNDAFVPIAFSLSDGTEATCVMTNKRGRWKVEVPASEMIRRSDDALKYDCNTPDGRSAVGSIESTIGAKIVASAVFIDLGITDAITDKHREYPASFVIPIKRKEKTTVATRTPPEAISGVADAMMCSDEILFDRAVANRSYWLLTCGDGEQLEAVCVDDTCYVN